MEKNKKILKNFIFAFASLHIRSRGKCAAFSAVD